MMAITPAIISGVRNSKLWAILMVIIVIAAGIFWALFAMTDSSHRRPRESEIRSKFLSILSQPKEWPNLHEVTINLLQQPEIDRRWYIGNAIRVAKGGDDYGRLDVLKFLTGMRVGIEWQDDLIEIIIKEPLDVNKAQALEILNRLRPTKTHYEIIKMILSENEFISKMSLSISLTALSLYNIEEIEGGIRDAAISGRTSHLFNYYGTTIVKPHRPELVVELLDRISSNLNDEKWKKWRKFIIIVHLSDPK